MKTLLLFLLLPTLTLAQTNVSGFISTNTTWTLAGSPYIVTGNALVSSGRTLTIESGVVVKFDTDKALQIDGELIAIGTPANRITFTSNQITPASGDWAKIHFPGTCVDAVFDTSGNYVSGSIMKYCDVLYGGGLGYGQIHIEGSSPYFDHCLITNSAADGIYCYGAASIIDSSTLKNCTGYGLSFDNPFANSSSLLVQTDTFINNSGGGLFTGTPGPGGAVYRPFEIRRNVFQSNAGRGAIYTDHNYTIGIRISENYFVNNVSSSATVRMSAKNYTVECNHFLNNQVRSAGTLFIDDYFSDTSYVRNNIFFGNISANAGVSVVRIACQNPNQKHHFVNNFIANNSTSGNSTCYFSGGVIADSIGQFYIYNNSIIDNIGNETIYLASGGGNNTTRFATLRNNNLVNPTVQYEIYNAIPYGSANIYAEDNYWGTTNTSHVDSVIYDYFDFANKSIVYYLKVLTSPVVIDTTCPSVILPTAINEFEEQNDKGVARIYPNPFSTQLTFSLTDNQPMTVSLYNFLGQQVLQQTFTNSTTINTGQLAGGIYFYALSNPKGTLKTGKVVKQ